MAVNKESLHEIPLCRQLVQISRMNKLNQIGCLSLIRRLLFQNLRKLSSKFKSCARSVMLRKFTHSKLKIYRTPNSNCARSVCFKAKRETTAHIY